MKAYLLVIQKWIRSLRVNVRVTQKEFFLKALLINCSEVNQNTFLQKWWWFDDDMFDVTLVRSHMVTCGEDSVRLTTIKQFVFKRRKYGVKIYPFSLLEPSVLYFIIQSILGHYENN